MPHHPQAGLGLIYGVLAYSCWGLIPLFFKLLAHLPPVFVLGHRILWSFVFFSLLVAARRELGEIRPALRSRRTMIMLLISAILIAINWGVFIYAITTMRVLDSSLGYFIAPLVVVGLGVIALRERLRAWQVVALAFAAGGVTVMTIAHGSLPWIALVVALTFGGYGLFRKTVRVSPVVGLCIETALLVPVGIALVTLTPGTPAMDWTGAGSSGWVLLLSGPVTAIPLLLFTGAARRLRLSTIGLLQYIGPMGQFALAVFYYHEPFGTPKLAGFALIWTALLVYSIDSLRAYRQALRPPPRPPETEPL